jgi:small subunit ribosomal protein S11
MNHPTFATHEVLWEFFLVPDMLQEQMAERAKLKSELVQEKIMDEYEPLTSRSDMNAVDNFVKHSREMVRRLNLSTRAVIRKGHVYVQAQADLAEALSLCAVAFASLGPPATTLPRVHVDTFIKFASVMHTEPASSPLATFVLSFASLHSTIAAVQSALLKPSTLINQINSTQRALEKNKSSLANNSTPRKGLMNINFPGSEESRAKTVRDTEEKILQAGLDIERFGKELRYTQEVVVGELAGWTTWREQWGREEIKRLARDVVVKERERLKCMQRALRALKTG